MPDPTDSNTNDDIQDLALTGLKEAVAERDRCLDGKNMVVLELMAKIGDLENQLNKKDHLVKKYKEVHRKLHLTPIKGSAESEHEQADEDVPWLHTELMDIIFFYCDYRTRIAISMTSTAFYHRYKVWNDVKHLYVRRSDSIEQDHCTIIPHSYQAITNSAPPGVIRFYHFKNMNTYFDRITTLILESSQESVVSRLNRVNLATPDSAFLQKFRNLEIVKFCAVKKNMGLYYTISDILSLPKIRVIHIREDNLIFGNLVPVASVEDIRLSLEYLDYSDFCKLCLAVQQTLRHLLLSVNLNFLPLVVRQSPMSQFTGDEYWRWMCSMPFLETVSYPKPLMRMTTLSNISHYFPSMLSMSTLTLESLNTVDIPVISTMLPDHCECIIVSEMLRVGDRLVKLNSLQNTFNEAFTPDLREILYRDCRAVCRKLRLQLGFWRAAIPASLDIDVGNVRVTAAFSKTTELINGDVANDRRVFFWNNQIYSRTEFLRHFGIDYGLTK
ncbi:unnamed protein product [Bursaphelenchus okinawaensis]|uniref:Uncharacterized protein n=1 Tax=Bursaphelenchus okinawaensis TaxID=465554 RepID=A0A811LHR2_9BILA|nr:unnamed protein product [Bursaphelenchus okinawaensis]CAG9125783.1 unnamed protein product [Bursaphelenchus okinawaensis]